VSARASRRAFVALAASVAASATRTAFAQASEDHGRINPPIPLPDIPVARHDGRIESLLSLVRGRATAMQLMFTACNTACPIEGAIFERVQQLIPDAPVRGIQLLSLSVDPARDHAEALRQWLRRFHAGPGWIAAAPRPGDAGRLRQLASSRTNPADNHSTQVHMINRRGELVFRTFELPEPDEVAAILRKM
jgi:protein SCO1/2